MVCSFRLTVALFTLTILCQYQQAILCYTIGPGSSYIRLLSRSEDALTRRDRRLHLLNRRELNYPPPTTYGTRLSCVAHPPERPLDCSSFVLFELQLSSCLSVGLTIIGSLLLPLHISILYLRQASALRCSQSNCPLFLGPFTHYLSISLGSPQGV